MRMISLQISYILLGESSELNILTKSVLFILPIALRGISFTNLSWVGIEYGARCALPHSRSWDSVIGLVSSRSTTIAAIYDKIMSKQF